MANLNIAWQQHRLAADMDAAIKRGLDSKLDRIQEPKCPPPPEIKANIFYHAEPLTNIHRHLAWHAM